jgi:hypothetical protein
VRVERVNNNSEFPRKVILPRYKVVAESDTDEVDKLRAEFDKLVEVLDAAGIMDKGFDALDKKKECEPKKGVLVHPSSITVSCEDPDLWSEIKASIVNYVKRIDGPVRFYIVEGNAVNSTENESGD